MDETLLEVLARAAGLEKAWRDFRADLRAALAQLEEQRRVLTEVPRGGEPWPPIPLPPRDD